MTRFIPEPAAHPHESDSAVRGAEVTGSSISPSSWGASEKRARETTSDLIALVAHEIRNALTEIVSAEAILHRSWHDLDPKRRDSLLEIIAHGSRRIKRLVDDLLTSYQLETGSLGFALEQVDLASLVSRVARRAEATYAQPVGFACPGELWVAADPSRVEQILENLLSNAAIYGEPPVRIDVTAHGPMAEVRVQDGGERIPDALAGRLFEKFPHGATGAGSGTGLGLSIVRALARGQGGEAWYELSPEGHTCFVFTLLVGG